MIEHTEVSIIVKGETVRVDSGIAELVVLMNRISSLQTLSSCQGDPGIIGEGGRYGHVAFRYGAWSALCAFCYDFLRDAFYDYIDDEVRVDLFCNSEPYAWIMFRAEMLPKVEQIMCQVVIELDGIAAGLEDVRVRRMRLFKEIQDELRKG